MDDLDFRDAEKETVEKISKKIHSSCQGIRQMDKRNIPNHYSNLELFSTDIEKVHRIVQEKVKKVDLEGVF